MSNAPYCPTSYSQPTTDRRRLQQPGQTDIPTIPPAHDLRSVITAINQMNNVFQHITRMPTQINNVYPPTIAGIPAPPKGPTPTYARLTWQEGGRNYNKQKVVNPEDKTQFIEINTISSVGWYETATGHTLRYDGH